jgi:hypothetical protein
MRTRIRGLGLNKLEALIVTFTQEVDIVIRIGKVDNRLVALIGLLLLRQPLLIRDIIQ